MQTCGIHTKPRLRIGADIADKHIHRRGQALECGKPGRRFKIKCYGLLAAIEIEEFAIHAGRTTLAGKLAQQIAAWAFKLDHLRAMFRKNTGANRPHHHRGKIKHPNTCKRSVRSVLHSLHSSHENP